MSVLGIDFGNDKCKVALPAGGKVDIVLNDVTNRETPTCVGFSDEERAIGETGLSSLNMNFGNTIRSLKCFLGRQFAEEIVQHEMTNVPFSVMEGPGGGVVFEVEYQGKQIVVHPEQVLGALLKRLASFAESHTQGKIGGVVVSCPSDYLDCQRRAIFNSCCIAGLKCLRVMSQSLAACLQYALSRLSELPKPADGEENRVVAIIDYGNCDMEATIGSFSQDGCKVLGASTGFGLGSRRLDFHLAEYIREDFKSKTGIDVRNNPRAWLRTLAAAERAKRFLSANKSAPINVESFCQDRDYSGSITREQLEDMAAPILDGIRVPIENALRQAGVSIEQLHSVEIIGGSRMIPAFASIVKTIFGVEPMKTLNATECIASGCAWQGAILSPSYRVLQFKVEDRVTRDVFVRWASSSNATSGNWDKEDSGQLFSAGETYPKAKAIRFREEDDLLIQAEYPVEQANSLAAGQLTTICNLKIVHPRSNPRPNTKKREMSVQLWTNLHGVVDVRQAKFVEEYEEWETVAKKSEGSEKKTKKEGEAPKKDGDATEDMEVDEKATEKGSKGKGDKDKDESETVLKTRIRETPCDVEVTAGGLSMEQVRALFEEEQNMIRLDQERMEAKELKNETESYVLQMRGRVRDGDLVDFCPAEIRNQFVELMDEVECWLYDEGFSATVEQYKDKLNTLKGYGSPILERFEEKQNRGDAIGLQQQKIGDARAWMTTTDEKYEHIDLEERQKVLDKCDEMEKWMSTHVAELQAQPDHADPATKCHFFHSKARELEKFAVEVMNKPKPKPKAKEEKKQEGAGGDQAGSSSNGDVDMAAADAEEVPLSEEGSSEGPSNMEVD